MINAELLQDICCPETHQSLAIAETVAVERLNQAIAAGTLKNRAGKPVTDKLDGALVRADGKVFYSVRNGIPVLLIDEALSL